MKSFLSLTHQSRLVSGRLALLVHLEDRQDEDLGVWPEEGRLIVAPDHLEELGGQLGTGIELDVAGEDVACRRRLARHVAPDVHRVQELALALVHARDANVRPGRRTTAVGSLARHLLARRDLRMEEEEFC